MPYCPTGRPPGRPRKKAYEGKIGDRPNLSQQKWVALTAELRLAQDSDHEPWPSFASLRSVARYAGVSHQTIWKWRKDPAYRQGFMWLAAHEVNEAFESKPTSKPLDNFIGSKRSNLANLHLEIHRTWKGPLDCMACGETIEQPEAYFQHIKKHLTAPEQKDRFVWVGDDLIGWFDDKKTRQVGLLSPFGRGFG